MIAVACCIFIYAMYRSPLLLYLYICYVQESRFCCIIVVLLYSNILLYCRQVSVIYFVLCMYIISGGGGVQIHVLYRGLVVVLSVQCVASTCAVLAWDRKINNNYITYNYLFQGDQGAQARTSVQSH
jgi:hypothetical protein